jgi:hypothetical protein
LLLTGIIIYCWEPTQQPEGVTKYTERFEKRRCDMKRVIVTSIPSFVFLFALGMVAYGETNKVKLTGAEMQWLISETNVVTFGLNHKFNSVWIIVSHGNGKRDIFWRSLVKPGLWMTNTGTAWIDGDSACSKWSNPSSRKSCYDVYRVGEDKYESWLQGSLVSTWFRGQTEYKEPKKKVKLTGTEIQRPGVFAGIGHKSNNVWILWAEGGKLEVYWRSLAILGFSGSDTTTERIEGDKSCIKWTFGPERCSDIYRIGEEKYESRLNGNLEGTYYKLK